MEEKNLGGQPRKFDSGAELIRLFGEFCECIADCGYDEAPTQTAFCRWLSKNYDDVDRKTIYNYLNKYFPNIKKNMEQLQSDTISGGAMLGKYQPTMSIFALKNWCGWGDTGMRSTYGGERKCDDPLTTAMKELAKEMEDEDADQ